MSLCRCLIIRGCALHRWMGTPPSLWVPRRPSIHYVNCWSRGTISARILRWHLRLAFTGSLDKAFLFQPWIKKPEALQIYGFVDCKDVAEKIW